MKENINFKCVQCGNCCSASGHVYLATKDRVRLAVHFGMTVPQFTKQYCEKKHGEFHLKNPDHDCCFLENGRCTVYEVRPEQCRTWPLWPENFRNGRLRPDAAPYCRGLQSISLHYHP